MEAVRDLGPEKNIRVVSMPCTERFDLQSDAYKEKVLGKGVLRLAIEASYDDWWIKYVGLEGKVIGMKEFGESAPGAEVAEYFGITSKSVYNKILEKMEKNND